MAFVFAPRVGIPLWTMTFVMVVITAPLSTPMLQMSPTPLFVIAVAGIALLGFAMPAALPWLRASRSLMRVPPPRHMARTHAAAMATATIVRRLGEANRTVADDAMDAARMDDDGGWQKSPRV